VVSRMRVKCCRRSVSRRWRTSSSAVSANLRQFAFGIVFLVLGAGAEELLPKCLGVGFPVLLATVLILAGGRGSLPIVFMLAIIAGALEDALASLPLLASVSYFAFVVLAVRHIGFPRLSAAVAYPCYQLWLAFWTSGSDVGIFSRMMVSLPFGGLTVAVVGLVLDWAKEKGAVDECD